MPNTLSYVLTANRVIRDTETKNFTCVDIFDTLLLPTPEKILTRSFCVYGKVYDVETGPFEIEISVENPEKQIIGATKLSGNLVAGDVEFYTYFNLVKFDKTGRHHVRVKTNGANLLDGDRYFFEVKEA